MQKLLIIIGITAITIGLLWPWLSRLPLGRLPGDILLERENFRLYLPLTSMILVSGLLTLIFWLFRR
ncbi:MAG: DUF2905 domain-containing protein [Candidatus Thiodiazotropha sp. (ex Monitilora ramsayi)]|nr:DUF2905 domain-containing protein [Candidatus Thiodiazotropha sp. (ex Monitilora ramsayi)]